MRLMRIGLCWLGVAVLGMTGCQHLQAPASKKRPPEEYVLPPGDDPRFSEKVQYPKGTLNQDLIKPDQAQPGGLPPPLPSSGMRGGSVSGPGGGGAMGPGR